MLATILARQRPNTVQKLLAHTTAIPNQTHAYLQNNFSHYKRTVIQLPVKPCHHISHNKWKYARSSINLYLKNINSSRFLSFQIWQQTNQLNPTCRAFSGSVLRSIPRGTVKKQRESPPVEEKSQDEGLETEVDQDSNTERDSTVRPHIPVMVNDVIDFMQPKEDQVFLDMTFGAGGHTEALLQHCDKCQVLALDRDPVAFELAIQMAEKYGYDRLFPLLGRFSNLSTLLQKKNVSPGSIDGVLIDAGCSSMQFDTAERGFALSKDGPLDMRMDGQIVTSQPTAADVVNSLDMPTLANILRTYGEESNSKKIAKNIVQYREKYRPIETTQELATVVSFAFTHREAAKSRDGLRRHSHVATKTFLALRIFVNNELNELSAGLKTAETFLRPGSGKLAVLSFHSLEDRIVKRFMQGKDVTEKRKKLHQLKKAAAESKYLDNGNESDIQESKWKMCKSVHTASQEEIEINPRCRSAKLRTAIRKYELISD